MNRLSILLYELTLFLVILGLRFYVHHRWLKKIMKIETKNNILMRELVYTINSLFSLERRLRK